MAQKNQKKPPRIKTVEFPENAEDLVSNSASRSGTLPPWLKSIVIAAITVLLGATNSAKEKRIYKSVLDVLKAIPF